MSTRTAFPALPACTLTIRLLGDLAVCVDDPAHRLTAVERRWGLTGPIVAARLGVVAHCSCDAWADTAACRHADELRAIILATVRQLRGADDTPRDQHDIPTRRAVAVAHLLVAPRGHLWPGMLPGRLRPGTPGFGELG